MARMLLVQGVAAAKAGDKRDARRYLERMLNFDPDTSQKIEAWLWLAEISDDPEEKRQYLEYVIGVEPWEPRARRGLAILRGELSPEEIVDPNKIAPQQPTQPMDVRTRRFVCPQCGGRLSFLSEAEGLSCPYCGHRVGLAEALGAAAIEEQEFVVALATAKGHTPPVATRAFDCSGCGAAFLLAPSVLSLSCPYCGSSHVVEGQRDLIEPQGIVPMRLSQEEAWAAMIAWLKRQDLVKRARLTQPAGVYLPAWTFDVGGEVKWRGQRARSRKDGLEIRWDGDGLSIRGPSFEDERPKTGGTPVFFDDIVVVATHTLPAAVMAEAQDFELRGLQPFDPGYLAGWPAEIYQVSAADASIAARQAAWRRAREEVHEELEDDYYRGSLRLSSHAMSILSYKLILLPFWLARYRIDEMEYHLVVNGQTGAVRGQTPPPTGWLSRLLGGLLG
jgi:DNA-directed RNA polymerase subunit RPC12/RpoP